MNQTPKQVEFMNDVDLVEYLTYNIGLSFEEIKRLFEKKINGVRFLLMEKKDIADLGILDRYSQICMLFPNAKFVDGFI